MATKGNRDVSDAGELSKVLGLKQFDTKHIIAMLKDDILRTLWREDPNALPDAHVRRGEELISSIESLKQLEENKRTASKVAIAAVESELREAMAERANSAGTDSQVEVEMRDMKISRLKDRIAGMEQKIDAFLAENQVEMMTLKDQLANHEKFSEQIRENNQNINEKIKEVYKEINKYDFNPAVSIKNGITPKLLFGPPGEGKTASYIVAAKEVCASLGLNFVNSITDDYTPSLRDYVMIIQESAGEVSSNAYGGIPMRDQVLMPDGSSRQVLKKALNYRFIVTEYCAGGTLLLDDVANATATIQNVFLPLAQFGTFQGLKLNHVAVGFTGNLGALDGTHVQELSTALKSRCLSVLIRDTPENFVSRAYSKFNDTLGDAGYLTFIMRNKEAFSQLPDSDSSAGFPCPRNHEEALCLIRNEIAKNGGRGVGEVAAASMIDSIASNKLGPKVGQQLAGFYQSYITGADPLARQFIVEGKINPEDLKEKYNKGQSAKNMEFGYQFATACGDYAANLISEIKNHDFTSDEFGDIVTRYGKSTLMLNDSELSFALDHFKNKLCAVAPDLTRATRDGASLRHDVILALAKKITVLPEVDRGRIEQIANILTDFDKEVGAKKIGAAKPVRKRA